MSNGRLTYRPGLDGLRALAVAAVLLYHLPVSWMRGGWLGVSAFFVLSGYLITSLLLAEHRTTGCISRTRFWARRLRRLMPASLACLGLVVMLVATGALVTTPTLRGDLLAALFDVENWRAYAVGGYDALWRAPSPVLHFWSLAIEEQWYLVWPIVVAACLARSRWLLPSVVAAGTAAAVITGALISSELAYLATFTRAAELLVGAGLALVLARWAPPSRSRLLDAAGIGGLAVVLVAFSVVPLDWPQLFVGGLLVFALVVAVVITSAVSGGVVARLLGAAPLVWLGQRSYGVYLYHWPLYLVFDERGWSTWWAILLTLALAELSYLVVEQPIRRARVLTAAQARAAVPTAIALVALAVLVVTPGTRSAPDLQVLAGATASSLAPATVSTGTRATAPASTPTAPGGTGSSAPAVAATPAPTAAPTTTLPPHPLRVAVVGDSTAQALGQGLAAWGQATGRAEVTLKTIAGCGLIRQGSLRFGGKAIVVPAGCRDWATRWPRQLATANAEVALVTLAPWEWVPRRWSGSGGWVVPTDAAYRQMLHGELLAATDVLAGRGRAVVWVTAAPIFPGWHTDATDDPSADDAQRRAANEVLREVVATHPGQALLVDLAGWLDANPKVATDASLRPDGVHWAPAAAEQIVDLVVAPALEQLRAGG